MFCILNAEGKPDYSQAILNEERKVSMMQAEYIVERLFMRVEMMTQELRLGEFIWNQ